MAHPLKEAIAILILVPLLDQTCKLLVIRRLGNKAISLGRLGEVRSIQKPIWMARAWPALKPTTIWIFWLIAASALILLEVVCPATALFSALILAGTLSHAIETSVRGSVCDYIALRFWPAFNLADVAITIGAVGLVMKIVMIAIR